MMYSDFHRGNIAIHSERGKNLVSNRFSMVPKVEIPLKI